MTEAMAERARGAAASVSAGTGDARLPPAPRLPLDHGYLAMLDASYGYLRQFTPAVLECPRRPATSS